MTDENVVSTNRGYRVASESHPGYFVWVTGRDCTCPAGHARSCRHRRLVAEFIRKDNERNKRPVAPPAIGLLCD